MRESTSVSDQADEHGKRLKLDPETESTAFAGISKTMSVTDAEALSNYNAAFFVQLDAAFSELKSAAAISEEQRYPSLTYNSLTQTVTVVTAPSSIHESSTLDGLRDEGHFPGLYARSRKEQDGGFRYTTVDGEDKVTIVYEVGYSEAYSKLLDDKDIWIHGKGVNVFILISFKETPRFAYPATHHTRISQIGEQPARQFSRTVGRTTQLNIKQGCYGPLRSVPGSHVGRYGSPLANDDLPGTLGIRISGFYPQDVWQASDIEDGTAPFNSSRFLGGLRRDISKAAQNRFEGFLFEKLGLL
ncbi:hypothetical protein V1524DRAFT_418353 [Lipomyces starkeyi]